MNNDYSGLLALALLAIVIMRIGIGRLLTFGALFVFLVAISGMAHARPTRVAFGDSLAVGFGPASGLYTIARVGFGSCAILRALTPRYPLDLALISAGTNDAPGPCVAAIRRAVIARRVYWIVPVNGARDRVLATARAYGDIPIFYVAARGRTWPHPARYFNVLK
jgi:hypothetical protein